MSRDWGLTPWMGGDWSPIARPRRHHRGRRSPWGTAMSDMFDEFRREMDSFKEDMDTFDRGGGGDLWNMSPMRPALGMNGPAIEQHFEGGGDSNEPGKYVMNIPLGKNIAPQDVHVNVRDNVVTIDAKTEQRSDDGNTSSRMYQEFWRKFPLPQNVVTKEVKSVLTPDGCLKIEAPLNQLALEEPTSTEIPVLMD